MMNARNVTMNMPTPAPAMPGMPSMNMPPSSMPMDMGQGMKSWIFASPKGEFYYLSEGWFVNRCVRLFDFVFPSPSRPLSPLTLSSPTTKP